MVFDPKTISLRIKELVENYTGGNNSKFANIIGTNEANIRNYINGTMPKFDIVASIANKFEINCEWLLLGEGEMTGKKKELSTYDVPKVDLSMAEKPKITAHKTKSTNGIPLVSGEVLGGFGNMQFAIREQDIQSLYKVPDFINVDFMIRVKGSSMYPKYNSGDVVACRIIKESQFIQWNKVHVVATSEQGILIKRLKKGENGKSLTAVSDNKDYDPFEIPKEEIKGLAIVVGVIRLE